MAIINLVDSTFTAKNIATALSVYEYTVPGTALWYHLFIQVRLVAVAGGGDYTINLRLNDGDILADDPVVPKTTYTAPAGSQNFWFAGEVIANSGDVLNIMCLGLAGDIAVVGSIRICHDNAVGVTTYGNHLDVAATGEAGVDLSNAKLPAAPTTLTNITVPTVATVTDLATIFSGITSLPKWLRGLFRKDAMDATAKSEINTGGGTFSESTDSLEAQRDNYTTPPTVIAIADQIWDEAIAGHLVAGSTGEALDGASSAGAATPASLWAYTTRTLTQSAGAIAAIVAGTALTIERGDTLLAALTGLASNTGYVSIDFTVKRNKDDADNDAVIRIRKNASGVGDGLLRLNGEVGTAALGSITVVSATALTINLSAAATDDLVPEQGLYYDIQIIFAASVQTITEGMCDIVADVTKAIA